MPTVGVFAAIFDPQGRVLCVKQNYPPFVWTTPGGKMEPGESPVEALKREVLEETGYRIEIRGLVGVYAAPFKDDLVLGFEAGITGKDSEFSGSSDEIADVGFFDPGNLPTPMKLNTAQRITDAAANARGVLRVFRSKEEHGALVRGSGDM